MAEKLGEALLDLDTDDRKFRDGIRRAERDAEGLGATFDGTAKKAMLLGKALGAAAAIGAVAFGKGVADAITRLEEMRKSSAQVDQALKNSGNTAKTSAAEIERWADQLENRTGRAAEEVMAVASNLATYGFGREEFYRALTLADDMAAAWGGDLKQNLEGLSRALDDPINGMAMLSKRGVKLTEDQKDLAAQFLATGDKARAQGVVFDALEAQVKGVAEAGFNGLTKAIAMGQKVWEDAFEDLVTGKGNTADLRDTLISLINTLTAPDFVAGVMGFGNLIIGVINAIAQAATVTFNAVRDLKDFFAGSDQEVSTIGLQAELARNQQQITDLRAQWEAAGSSDQRNALANDAAALMDRNQVLQAELDRRAAADAANNPPVLTTGGGNTPPVAPVLTDEQQKQKKARQDLIADLQFEAEMVGKTALEQQVLNAQRRVGVTDMDAEGQAIRKLITETEAHKLAIEQQQQAYELLGEIGQTALKGLISAMEDGKVTGTELLGILADVLKMAAQFFMQQAVSGMGENNPLGTVLSSLFSGFFAKGGLIPSGTFGIVGENGPEPIIGTSRGAMVLPNSSLSGMGGGTNNITINGSGLTQSELTQAVTDALDLYDRFTLPGRVASINADPLARG